MAEKYSTKHFSFVDEKEYIFNEEVWEKGENRWWGSKPDSYMVQSVSLEIKSKEEFYGLEWIKEATPNFIIEIATMRNRYNVYNRYVFGNDELLKLIFRLRPNGKRMNIKSCFNYCREWLVFLQSNLKELNTELVIAALEFLMNDLYEDALFGPYSVIWMELNKRLGVKPDKYFPLSIEFNHSCQGFILEENIDIIFEYLYLNKEPAILFLSYTYHYHEVFMDIYKKFMIPLGSSPKLSEEISIERLKNCQDFKTQYSFRTFIKSKLSYHLNIGDITYPVSTSEIPISYDIENMLTINSIDREYMQKILINQGFFYPSKSEPRKDLFSAFKVTKPDPNEAEQVLTAIPSTQVNENK